MKNGVEEIENVCKLYGRGKYAIGSRSITIDDINKITGYNPNNIGKYDPDKLNYGTPYGQGKIDEYGKEISYYWKATGEPYYEGTGISGNLIGQHGGIFRWFDENSEEFKEKSRGTNSDEYLTSIVGNYYDYDPLTLEGGLDSNSNEYKMLFTKADENIENYYWTSSKLVQNKTEIVFYGIRGVEKPEGIAKVYGGRIFASNNSNNNCKRGIRPVITLQPNIKLTGDSTNGWSLEDSTIEE